MYRNKRKFPFLALAAVVAFGFAVWANAQPQMPPDEGPGDGPGPPALTPIQILGQSIFFDETLSSPAGQSCASCHAPEAGWVDNRGTDTSEGVVAGRFGPRNSLPVMYVDHGPEFHYDALTGGYVGGYYWDGRAKQRENQARIPFFSKTEMNNMNPRQVIRTIRRGAYASLFQEVFGPGAWDDDEEAFKNVQKAVTAFQESWVLNRFRSRFDQYRAGDTSALTLRERAGLELFEGKAGCASCHPSQDRPDGVGALFTTHRYVNLGVPRNGMNPFYDMPTAINPDGDLYVDHGLGGHLTGTAAAAEKGKFKIPSLRNVAKTGPYMHNGVFATLDEAVMFHNTRDVDSSWGPPEVAENVYTGPPVASAMLELSGPTLPPDGPDDPGGGVPRRIGNLMLTDAEVADIVRFLQALSDQP